MTDGTDFFNQMLGHYRTVEDSRLPYETRRDAVLEAYNILRKMAAVQEDRGGPDFLKALYYAQVILPMWASNFSLILDGREPRDRKTGQVIEWPKII